MDYKYIEQLLDKYWNCETTLEQEQILRAFFRQPDLPAHLLPYRPYFTYPDSARHQSLGADFDARLLARIERPTVRARRLTFRTRILPLCKAAAFMALVFSIGGAVRQAVGSGDAGIVYVHDTFERNTTDPQVAQRADSLQQSGRDSRYNQPPAGGERP